MGRREVRGGEPAERAPALGGMAALLQAKGLAASEEALKPPPTPVAAAPAVFSWSQLPRVVLRMERKGHGGKTVTVVGGVPAVEVEEAAALLRKAFGTGARPDGEEIVLQGDLRERLRAWLLAAGVRDVRG